MFEVHRDSGDETPETQEPHLDPGDDNRFPQGKLFKALEREPELHLVLGEN